MATSCKVRKMSPVRFFLGLHPRERAESCVPCLPPMNRVCAVYILNTVPLDPEEIPVIQNAAHSFNQLSITHSGWGRTLAHHIQIRCFSNFLSPWWLILRCAAFPRVPSRWGMILWSLLHAFTEDRQCDSAFIHVTVHNPFVTMFFLTQEYLDLNRRSWEEPKWGFVNNKA